MSLANHHQHTKYASLNSKESVNTARGRVVFESIGKTFFGLSDRTMSSSSRDVVHFSCLNGRSSLFPGDRSVAKQISHVSMYPSFEEPILVYHADLHKPNSKHSRQRDTRSLSVKNLNMLWSDSCQSY